jgi:hypothetical protein
MDNIYTFDKKKKLMERINKLTSRSSFEQVKKIIVENNQELESMQNQNGLFLQFNNLNNDTYIELTSYLDKLDKANLKRMKDEIMETSEAISDEDTFNGGSEKNMSKKLRLTNTESHIINRVKYEKELEKNNNMTDIEELSVYDPETSHNKKPKADIFVSLDDGDKKKNKKIVVKADADQVENKNSLKKTRAKKKN